MESIWLMDLMWGRMGWFECAKVVKSTRKTILHQTDFRVALFSLLKCLDEGHGWSL